MASGPARSSFGASPRDQAPSAQAGARMTPRTPPDPGPNRPNMLDLHRTSRRSTDAAINSNAVTGGSKNPNGMALELIYRAEIAANPANTRPRPFPSPPPGPGWAGKRPKIDDFGSHPRKKTQKRA